MTKQRKSPVFNLKLSEKEKFADDGQWFKDYMGHIVQRDNSIVEDYNIMKTSYEVANNNLDGFRAEIQAFCNPAGKDMDAIEENVVPYPELHNKINVLKGEILSRNDQHRIMLLTAKAVKDKDDERYRLLMESVDEKLAIEIEKQKMQMQQMSQEEIDQYVKELRTKLEPQDLLASNWLSEMEIFYSKALQYCMYDQDIKMKKMDTLEDTIITDRFFVYCGWKHGKPHIEIRNPMFVGFHKNPNERYVQKGSWIWYKKALTPADVFSNYDLTEEQLQQLGIFNSTFSSSLDKRHAVGATARPIHDDFSHNLYLELNKDNNTLYNKDVGLNMSSDRTEREKSLIWETHFEFKAFKQLIFLSYTDEYNKEIVTPMPIDFEIPENAQMEKFINRYGEKSERYRWVDDVVQTEFTAEKLWIPRKYEVVRLGDSVYPIFREVPYQYTNIEQPYSTFELSTKGAIFNARNAKSVSLLQRALAPYFQFIYIKHIQNRELSKYQGAIQAVDVDQIPDMLGEDVDGKPIRDKLVAYLTILKKTNKDFYSGSQSSLGGLPPATRSPGSSGYMLGTAVELLNLQNLLEYTKREIGLAMGISPQREAAFDSGSNVTDNKQAITQSHHITEPYFFIHSEIWKSALNDWLNNFRTYCENVFNANPQLKEHSIHYFLPDGTSELLKVTPETLRHCDVGLYLTNSGQIQQYTDYMLQLVHAFAQNSGEGMSTISGLLKDMVSGASPEEIHKRIVVEEQKQQKRAEQMEQMKLQSQEKQVQMQIEAREDEQAHQIELAVVKETERRITEIQKGTISALGFAEDTDVNDNQVPDIIDVAKLQLEGKKLELQGKEFEHQKEVDKEQLKLKKEDNSIKRMKKASTSK